MNSGTNFEWQFFWQHGYFPTIAPTENPIFINRNMEQFVDMIEEEMLMKFKMRNLIDGKWNSDDNRSTK